MVRKEATDFLDSILVQLVGLSPQEVYFTFLSGTGPEVAVKWKDEIPQAILKCEVFIAFSSPNSRLSELCSAEVGAAIAGSRYIVPLCLGRKHDAHELLQVQAYKLTEENLLTVIPTICEKLGRTVPDHAHLGRVVSAFCQRLKPVPAELATIPWEKQTGQSRKRLILSPLRTERREKADKGQSARQKRLCYGVQDLEENDADRKARLRNLLTSGAHRIPTKYLYSLEGGWEAWRDLCGDDHYPFYRTSMHNLEEFAQEIIDEAVKATGDPEFDFVSLGCGDGRKDRILLEEMHLRLTLEEQFICYYPLDICEQLLRDSAQLLDKNPLSKVVEVFTIEGDICSLRRYREVYEHYSGNNFFCLLGNTVGNNDELEIFEALSHAMVEKDLILFEINTDRDAARSKTTYALDKERHWKRHTLPLSAVGFRPKKDQVRYRWFDYKDRTRKSVVDDTVTVQATYIELTLDECLCSDVVLSTVHHYSLEKFFEAVAERIGLTEVKRWEKNGIGYLLCQKTRSAFSE